MHLSVCAHLFARLPDPASRLTGQQAGKPASQLEAPAGRQVPSGWRGSGDNIKWKLNIFRRMLFLADAHLCMRTRKRKTGESKELQFEQVIVTIVIVARSLTLGYLFGFSLAPPTAFSSSPVRRFRLCQIAHTPTKSLYLNGRHQLR